MHAMRVFIKFVNEIPACSEVYSIQTYVIKMLMGSFAVLCVCVVNRFSDLLCCIYCFVSLRSVFVPKGVCVSGLFILYWPFGFL